MTYVYDDVTYVYDDVTYVSVADDWYWCLAVLVTSQDVWSYLLTNACLCYGPVSICLSTRR